MSEVIIEQKEKISGKVAIPEVINGAGIKSIEQTSTSSEDGGVNTITVTLTDGGTSIFEVRNGSKGSQGNPGEKGDSGTTLYDDLEGSPIKNVTSDENNMVSICELPSGVYHFSGAFTPYPGSNIYYNFSKNQLVNIITAAAGTHLQSFYPDDNTVQFCAIMRDDTSDSGWTVEKKDVCLNDIVKSVNGATPDDNGNVVVQAGAQPDWDQNDSTALDYVKNRPFFKTDTYALSSSEDITLTNSVGTTWNINWRVKRIIILYNGNYYELEREPDVIDACYYWGYEKYNSGECPFYANASVLGDSEAEIHTSFFDSPITINCSYYSLKTVYTPISSDYLPSERILPLVYTFDEGSFLRVSSDGKWVKEEVAIPDAVTDDHINSLIDAKAVTDDHINSLIDAKAVTDNHINSLIDAKLGVIENGTY